MSKNPYDVLGVSPNASDDEIKRAYRDMSRKYHPDANVNNPLADLAEEKFKEVQEAYNMIMKERESGSSGSYGYGYGSNGSYQQSSSSYGGQQQDVEMQAAMNFVNSRRYQDAINVLNRMPQRNAQWYYISAVANANIGSNVLARQYAEQAVNMEPGNMQYRQLLNQLQWNNQRYQTSPYGNGYGTSNTSCGTGNACCDLWCADSLCECMGGDLCSCM